MTETRRLEIIKKFLKYSFCEAGAEAGEENWFEFSGLTHNEQHICTEEEFNELVAWVKEG